MRASPAALLLSGCGALQGGADYAISWDSPDGTRVKAYATVVHESDAVRVELIRDEKGVRSLLFIKTGARQGVPALIEELK